MAAVFFDNISLAIRSRHWSHHPSLQERDQEIEGLYAALEKKTEATSSPASVPHVNTEGPRRSQRLLTQTEQGRLQTELDQCRAELLTKTVGKLTETFWCQDWFLSIQWELTVFLCFPVQSWPSWSLSSRSHVQQAPSLVPLTASWRRANGLVPALLYEVHHFSCVRLLILRETKPTMSPPHPTTEPASAALGSAETWGGPAVRWTSLLPQHRGGEAAAGINGCRWHASQTGKTEDKQARP